MAAMVGLEEALIGKENVCQLLVAVLRGKGAAFEVKDGAAAALTVHVEDVAVGDGEVFAAGELYGERLCGERILREEARQKGLELRRIFKERL